MKFCRHARSDGDLPYGFAFGASPGPKLDDHAHAGSEQFLTMAEHLGLEAEPEFVVNEADA
ncbi:MAG TPA: hypothetical protein VF989_06325 [Polyangiaceae bacterium]